MIVSFGPNRVSGAAGRSPVTARPSRLGRREDGGSAHAGVKDVANCGGPTASFEKEPNEVARPPQFFERAKILHQLYRFRHFLRPHVQFAYGDRRMASRRVRT